MMKKELIPAIVYGQEEPTLIFVNRRELYKKWAAMEPEAYLIWR